MATPYKNLVQLESVTNQYYAKHIAPILEREIKLIKEYNTKIVKEAYKEAKRNSWKSHTNLTHPGKYFTPSKVKIMRPTSPK